MLLVYTNLGALNSQEPAWALVYLVGENYNSFLFQINPRSICHDIHDPRFIYSDAKRVGLVAVRKALLKHLPKLYPELTRPKFYLYKADGGVEYWSEIEEEVREKYGRTLNKYLVNKKPLFREV